MSHWCLSDCSRNLKVTLPDGIISIVVLFFIALGLWKYEIHHHSQRVILFNYVLLDFGRAFNYCDIFYLSRAVVWLKIKHSIQSTESFICLSWARVWSLAPPIIVMTGIFKTHERHLWAKVLMTSFSMKLNR